MTLRLFNTLSREKEVFTALQDRQVKMYVCGVTVYDFCHLGHARAYIVWDIVRRYLEFLGYSVSYIQNITDVDDKIIKRAQEENTTIEELTDRFISAYNEDMGRLNIKPATHYPRATKYIDKMIDIIQLLIDKDIAYVAGGDVYYAVQKFPSYGKLSHRSLEGMQAGASGRVNLTDGEPTEVKRYPFDFALWKTSKAGEMGWESPWGRGRPGWHIECSAMVQSCLGETIDIHAGGADLQFPHHENEIAQSEAHTGKPLAQYWMHNGFVNIGGEKMSKSLRNFKTIRSVLDYYHPMAVRLFILQAHYRQPIDFTEEGMENATKSWNLINEGLSFKSDFLKTIASGENEDSKYLQDFRSAMDDDFNTPVALAIVVELAKILKKERNLLDHGSPNSLKDYEIYQTCQTLEKLCNTLGLLPEEKSVGLSQIMAEEQILDLIAQRKQAKKEKNYKESDRIRDELKAKGIELIDLKSGETTWKHL